MKAETLSERLMTNGAAQDMREYQELKTSKEMEVEGTRKLYEHLKRQHGETVAIEMLKAKGYDPRLL